MFHDKIENFEGTEGGEVLLDGATSCHEDVSGENEKYG